MAQTAGQSGSGRPGTPEAPPTVADFLVQRLRAWGVQRIFGYAGDGINPIMGALDRAGNRPELIQPVHEELAALMACAHAKFTAAAGVCLATQGPGAIHTLNGLYDAALDHQPVVAIVGQQARESLGGRAQQEVDLRVLFKDVARAYVQEVVSPEQVKHVVDRAFRIALAERTVTCVILPHDVQQEPAVEEPAHEHGAQHSGMGYSRPLVVPREEDLRRAAAVLNAGRKVAVLVGAGALGATDEVIAVAERLGAGVAKALLGKAAVPDDLPFVTGSAGWLGTAASNAMLQQCDTLLMVGSGFPYTEFLPAPGQARGVQIDIAGRMLSLRYPMEVGLVGDSAETLRALLPLLEAKTDSWRPWVEQQVAGWWRTAAERALQPASPLNPQRLFHELSPRLPDGCIVAGDSGSSTVWYARHLKLRRGMQASLSGTLATMGSAIPYALAAKYAYPDRPVIATAGDGAMQMNGINALIDVARAWRRWSDPRLIVLVLNNRELNYVTWEQRVMEGEPKFPASQDIPDFPYARYAQLLGLGGLRVDAPEAVAGAWDEALAADRPVLVEAVVDPDVPTVPPELKPEQVEQLRRALAQGDPNAAGVLRQARAEGVLAEEPGQ
ncbi:MAG TPA: thiamine pyrophosphate-requiring protein [Chloroflexota bacterium]|nr:thiamine pyrophosphate-requiring protein [Chloroflexota bacterium]